jgi:serine/threonine protein kinase
MPTLVGTRLDKYEIQSEVGHGGMAVVYRGLDTVLNREVAVKVLHPHMAAREESRARLRREALTVAKLRHENILEIYDYSGEDAAESYLVTEFIHGMTLREWLDTRWRPRPRPRGAGDPPAVRGAGPRAQDRHRPPRHQAGERDDPAGRLPEADGLRHRQIIDHQKLTMTGQLLGSPAYMAPELISGKPIDARTDLFAVGIMLYQLSTGTAAVLGAQPARGAEPHRRRRVPEGMHDLPAGRRRARGDHRQGACRASRTCATRAPRTSRGSSSATSRRSASRRCRRRSPRTSSTATATSTSSTSACARR